MPLHVQVFSRAQVDIPKVSLLRGHSLGESLPVRGHFPTIGGGIMRPPLTPTAAVVLAVGALLGWSGLPRESRLLGGQPTEWCFKV